MRNGALYVIATDQIADGVESTWPTFTSEKHPLGPRLGEASLMKWPTWRCGTTLDGHWQMNDRLRRRWSGGQVPLRHVDDGIDAIDATQVSPELFR